VASAAEIWCESLVVLNRSVAAARWVLCQKALRAAPEELQSGEDGDQGDERLQLASRNDTGQRAAKQHARDSPFEELQQNRAVQRAELPMEEAA
jgi:hypothetical protein